MKDLCKTYDVKLEPDHLKRVSNVAPIKGLEEAIWNSLDADATKVTIKISQDEFNHVNKIVIIDNGHGISVDKVQSEFASLGGSFKKFILRSPNKRKYHGAQGAGRFKMFSMGNNIEIESVFKDEQDKLMKSVRIALDVSDLKRFRIEEISEVSENTPTGTKITITNISVKAYNILNNKDIDTLEELFTVYHSNYPDFEIIADGTSLDFEKNIRFVENLEFELELAPNSTQEFKLKIIEWKNSNTDKKLCFCNSCGVTLEDKYHKMRVPIPISIYVLSDYFEEQNKNGLLNVPEFTPELSKIVEKAKDLARIYALNRVHGQAKEYIEDLKKENLYPYSSPPKNEIEKIEQQVFDITALQLKEYLPISSHKKVSKKEKAKDFMTLRLIKEAISCNPSKVAEIVKAFLGLSNKEQTDFADLLERTTLSAIINTSKEISDRLVKIDGFKSVILGDLKEKVLERKHLQKLIVEESWIFGDNYLLGAADNTLKNVLKKYLKNLGRDDFEEVFKENEDSRLTPDICLWKQYRRDYAGNKENLIIEIKKPKIKVGFDELNQIKKYANAILEDSAFPKDKTFWTFILLTNDINPEIKREINQKDREPGLTIEGEHHKIFVKRWSDVLNDAEARLSFLKEKLNHQVKEDEGVALLRKLHPDYLPKETEPARS